jgi:hypothetical protein
LVQLVAVVAPLPVVPTVEEQTFTAVFEVEGVETAPVRSWYARKLTVVLVVCGPAWGRALAAGVAPPMIE